MPSLKTGRPPSFQLQSLTIKPHCAPVIATGGWFDGWTSAALTTLALVFVTSHASSTLAQNHKWHDEGFDHRRVVELPAGIQTPPEIVVAEFFTHGSLTAEQGDVAVYANRDPVAFYVLQRGPGDMCRVAFQAIDKQPRYFIYYGGNPTANPDRPKWTAASGLLLETRRWQQADLNDLDSVRQAFAKSARIGADFVGGVFHRHNPFATDQSPFLSRYAGTLNAPLAGEYTFFTSSQDCSFLLIDGQAIVTAPGKHGPESRAKIKGTIELTEGPHKFEYYHAASGELCTMVAAWTLPGFDRPSRISPDVFSYNRVLRIPPVHLEHRDDGYLPDFRMAILGDIPSHDKTIPAMVRTQFVDASIQVLTQSGKYHWSFGDGQESEFANPAHIFLHPGLHRVSLKMGRLGKEVEVANRVYITRQFIVDSKGQENEDLASYLETLEQYNSANLDGPGLVQLVRAYLLAEDPVNAHQAAVAAFTPTAAGHTDQTWWALAHLVGPVVRHKLDNPQAAAEIWVAASKLIERDPWQAVCAVEAADIQLNDLLLPAQALASLRIAERHLPDASPITRSRYHRVLGDLNARMGNGEAGRRAYLKADAVRELAYNTIERNAWRGAHSRSTEAYLRSEEIDRAGNELQRWLRDFPADKADGYLSLLQMRYRIARRKTPQAIAVANDLLEVNPSSPYADRLVFLIAKSEERSHHLARAVAIYRTLIADYPGSPLVDSAQAEIERIEKPADAPAGERPKK